MNARAMNRHGLGFPSGVVSYGLVVVSGVIFAALVHPLMNLSPRWMLAAIAGCVLLSTCFVLIARLSDFLLTALFFSIPLAGIAKNYFPSSVAEEDRGSVFYSGTLNLGLIEVLLVGLYGCWLARLLSHRQGAGRLVGLDWLILLLIVAHVLSLFHAPEVVLGVLATLHLLKQFLLYLYISRNMLARHFELFLAMIAFAIVLQTGLGAVQTASGGALVGIARDKGAGAGELGSQYEVAKIEHIARAEGTLTDSHELGALFAMLLPIPLAIAVASEVKRSVRALGVLVVATGLIGLGITFSRSAIVGFALAICLFVLIHLFNWPTRTRVPTFVILLAIGAGTLLALGPVIGARYSAQSIADALDLRWQQYETAVHIWLISPVIGYGAGNYMHGARLYGNEFTELLPVHNISLWFIADTGVIGAIAFHGILIAALRRYWMVIRLRAGLLSRVALGGFTGLVSCFLDSLTEPLLRAPTIFAIFWTLIALSVSLPSFVQGPDRVGRRLLRA